MSVTIQLPNITAPTTEGQMQQMRGYLYQMAQELEFALNDVDRQSAQRAFTPHTQKSGAPAEREAIENFNDIKSLIIKSADIVNAYYEQMNTKFRGDYTAQSDFGTFQERTEQEIRQNSQSITQIFGNTQQISSQLGEVSDVVGAVAQRLSGLTQTVQEVRATIRTGLLYTDGGGVPVYGMEIGQQVEQDGVEVFRKFCRLVADRLSFYDAGGNEVAYLSDNRMHVTDIQAESVAAVSMAVERMQIGDYLLALGADGHLSLI